MASRPSVPPPCELLPEPVRTKLLTAVTEGTLILPVLPQVAAQIMLATSDDRSDAKTLADIIRHDQAITGHMLRIANSPLYMSRVKIASLQQAVSRLGMQAIRQIAMVIACQMTVFKAKGYEKQVREFFQHSIATAVFAQEIARLRRWNVEESFLGGLLHDLGRPVLLQATLDLHTQTKTKPELAGLMQATDLYHEAVGGRMAASWSLPKLSAIFAAHHDPDAVESQSPLSFCIRFADDLAHHAMPDQRTLTLEEIQAHPLVEKLNLYPDDVATLLKHGEMLPELVAALL